MTRTSFLLIVLCGLLSQALAQKQSPSLIYQNHVISYNIVRYSPVWRIQDGSGNESATQASSKLFRNVRASETSALRSFLFNGDSEPAHLKGLDGSEMLADLSNRIINIYYRIEYKGQEIYLATLNNHASRSIIPFRNSNGIWKLDVDFMNDPFFDCLQHAEFNPYVGEFTGRALCSYGFEDLESGVFKDHSGYKNDAMVKGATVVNGRIGSAVQVNRSTNISFDLAELESGKQLYVDFHINIGSALESSKWRNVIKAENEGVVIEYRPKGENRSEFRVTVKGSAVEEIRIELASEKWHHVNFSLKNGIAELSVDGVKKADVRHDFILTPSKFVIEGNGGARFKLDELNIGI